MTILKKLFDSLANLFVDPYEPEPAVRSVLEQKGYKFEFYVAAHMVVPTLPTLVVTAPCGNYVSRFDREESLYQNYVRDLEQARTDLGIKPK